MGFEGLGGALRKFADDESGAGKPPKTEKGIGLLRAAVVSATMAGGIIAASHGKREDPQTAPIEETDRNGLSDLIEKIDTVPVQTFGKEHFTEQELKCLTDNVYHEARGEQPRGQYAVMFATLGRALDKKYPKSVCGVVHQPMQFSWTADQNILTRPINPREYLKIAIEVHNLMQGRDIHSASVEAGLRSGLPHGAIFYKLTNFTGSKRVEQFFARLQHVLTVGKHDFFIQKAAAHAAHQKKHGVQPKTVLSRAPLQQRQSRQAGKNRAG